MSAQEGEHTVDGNQVGLWFTDGKGGLTRLDFDAGTVIGPGAKYWLSLSDRDRAICLALLNYAMQVVERTPDAP